MTTVLMIGYSGLFISTLLAIVRLVLGPTTLDRILAFDAISLCAAGMVILFSIQTNSFYFLEVLLIFCLLGFITVLGYMDYLSHTKKKNLDFHQKGSHDVE